MKIPHRTPFFLPLLFPSLLWRVPTDRKEVFLTFDDGPIHGPTEFVLDELKKFDIRATFFCIGDNIRKHRSVFRRIVDEGHTIGNHTFNHVSGWGTDTREYLANIELVNQTVANEGIQAPHLFRPPYGRITFSQVRALQDIKIVMWDVLSCDYAKNVSPEECLAKTLRAVRPGSIIVFHDSLKAEKNMTYALPRFVERLLNDGYQFKTLAA